PYATFKYMDMGWDEKLRQNLVTALLGGTAPDIIVGENFIQPYAEIGAFLPMNDTIQDIKDNLVEGTYAAATLKGKIYGVSQITGCFGFERNPNVIEKAGLDPDNPPKYWSELLEQAAAITKAGKGEYYGYTLQGPVGFLIGGILRFAVYYKTAGASMCKNDCTYPWYNDPKAEKVLTFLREIHKYTPPGLSFNPNEGEVYSQLFKGKSAYQICGSWHVRWAKDSGLENAKYSFIPIPDEDGIQATGVVGNVILSVLSGTKYPAEALYFCRCFVEDEVQNLVYPIMGRLPSTRSALKALRPKTEPANQMFIDLLLTADLGVLPQWRKDPQKLWSVYNDMMTKLLTTDIPVKQLMDEAQAAAEKVMEG
ncbi:MAG: extracellular solute-binding protein, partial [Anaerolineae bacterium]|nr:extracellular solute-binding protein [Anaerolineae bacterium]